MKRITLAWFTVNLFIFLGNVASAQSSAKGQLEDREGNMYIIVKIGDQFWMAENLAVSTFTNGDKIKEASTAEEWEDAYKNGDPAWCWYNNAADTGKMYGKLYNQHAMNDSRGLAPEGWHIPSDKEWKQLEMAAGMSEPVANRRSWRGNIGGKLKSERTEPDPHPRWDEPNKGATNETGFSVLPGGYRTGNPNYEEQKKSTFRMLGKEAAFWTDEGGGRAFWGERIQVYRGSSRQTKGFGFSVRCVKD